MRHESDTNSRSLERLLASLSSDNRSGAAEILSRAADLFTRLRADRSQETIPTSAQAAVLETAVALVRAQPDMAPLARLAHSALEAARRAATAQAALREAEQAARDFVACAARAAKRTAAHAARLIDEAAVVLTHSRSSTVLAALCEAARAGLRFRVIATESRPMMEGRALVETLAGESVNVTLIADAAAALVMPRVSCVMVGADRLTTDHLVNKVGTRMIALAARERSIKMIALCDTSKFIAGWPAAQESCHPPDELWPAAPPRVEIINRYFEPTPLEDFAAVVSEDGLLAPREAGRRAAGYTLDPALLCALGG